MAQIKIIESNESYYKSIGVKRDVGIDIVKTIAILSVVGVHFFLNTRFYRVELDNFNLFIQTYIQQIFLICIPLFVMSTGYLNNNTEISKNYFKKILPIIYLYLLYSIPALIYRYQIGEIPLDIPMWIEQVLEFKGNRYSWYINLYIGLFLLIPFLNRMYNSIDTKKEKHILIGILILLTCATTIRELHLPDYWSSIYPITYYFIGKYIRDFSPRMNVSKNIILLVGIILVQTIYEYLAAGQGEYRHILTDYSSIFRLIEAYLLFILVYKIDIKNDKVRALVTDISKLTLDIYLVSFITDRLTYRVLKPYNIPQECYIYIMIPLVFVSFVFAYGVAKLRAKYIRIR